MLITAYDLEGWQAVLVFMLVIVVFGGLLGGTIYATLKAAAYPPPVALLIVLTSITLALISAYLITRDAELLTLAGMGLGAISGAVAAVWGNRHEEGTDKTVDDFDEPEEKDEPE